MIWLDMMEENGSAFYLDIRGIEPRRRRGETLYAISGVLGDGRNEAEVLLDVGAEVEVVFVDEWLNSGRLRSLFAEVSREELVRALAESAADIAFCIESFPVPEGRSRQRVRGYRADGRWLPVRPQVYGDQLELPLTVAEAA